MTSPYRRWLTPMRARSSDEPHRVSTPLELFFDLCFVVAVSQAALPLHHSIAEGEVLDGVRGFLLVFFSIWWAWMNFTWFASAYDTDDDVYRLTTLVQIVGALVLAAGVEEAFDHTNFTVITIGYVIMRLATVGQWLRAARADPQRRATAMRYAIGVSAVQVLWLLRLLVPDEPATMLPVFVALALLELAVPIWAERAPGGPTTYHPHHIAERYGLFTLIVLGESVMAATIAVQAGFGPDIMHEAALIRLAIAGVIIVFALWWIYFAKNAGDMLNSLRTSLLWGYGHYFIFAAAAAVGAGLAVRVDFVAHDAEISTTLASYAIAVPVAVYLFFVWLLHLRPERNGFFRFVPPGIVVLVLLTPLVPASIELIAVLLVGLVTVHITLGRKSSARSDR
ncbi:low temperature requirement protein A [Actinoplanes solisilvae]|uniref:low temperature requirement protein A n=1 Tax=Actinoplanes solisilvae TaxID=2486853 RepID=UPI001F0C330F|nr:low temperature requirement protein A [Actinoplanes solisilvae]